MSSGSGSGLGSSQITASVPSPRIEILCVSFKNEISFLQPFGTPTPKSNHHLPSKPDVLRAHLPSAGPSGQGAHSFGRTSAM